MLNCLRASGLKALGLAAFAALVLMAGAQAQIPKGPTRPKPPVKPATAIKPTPAPGKGAVLVICRDFRAVPYTDSKITYETMSVRDTSGKTRTIYAPTHIVVAHAFKPSAVAIGANGRDLASGECGAPNAVIGGTTGSAILRFDNFPMVYVEMSKSTAGDDIPLRAAVNLGLCPSGLRSFRATRQNANEFLIANPADATCLG